MDQLYNDVSAWYWAGTFCSLVALVFLRLKTSINEFASHCTCHTFSYLGTSFLLDKCSDFFLKSVVLPERSLRGGYKIGWTKIVCPHKSLLELLLRKWKLSTMPCVPSVLAMLHARLDQHCPGPGHGKVAWNKCLQKLFGNPEAAWTPKSAHNFACKVGPAWP